MANIYEVRAALKQGDRKTASTLLKQVLQNNPSAEAWYTAAQLTADKEAQLKYLNRGLALDPNHRPCQTMLRELGGKQKTMTSTLIEEIAAVNPDQQSRIALLNNPKARLALAGLSAFLVIMLCGGIALSFVLGSIPQRPPNWVDVTPATSVPMQFTGIEPFKAALNAPPFSLISLGGGAPVADTTPDSVVTINLRDGAGQAQVVTLYYYDMNRDPFATRLLKEAGSYMKMDNDYYDILRSYQGFLVYPTALDATTVTALQTAFGQIGQLNTVETVADA